MTQLYGKEETDDPDKLCSGVVEILTSTPKKIITFRKSIRRKQEDAEILAISDREKEISRNIEWCT